MVDHRADEENTFRVYQDPNEGRFSFAEFWDRAREWLFARPEIAATPRRRTSAKPDPAPADQQKIRRIALVVSALWAAILGTYGFGYFLRLDAMDAGTRLLPTLDLLFFAFAIAGPIAMVWIVVLLLERASHLSAAIEGQSESALALAATLANFNESVDALSANTTGRLEQACDRMEREAQASVAALDRNLAESTMRLESALLESVTLLHERALDRDQQLQARLDTQRSDIEQRLEDDAHRLALAIETEVATLRETKDLLIGKIEAGFAASRERVDQATGEVFSRQQLGLAETNHRVHAAISSFAERLTELRDAQARMVEDDLAPPMEEISRRLEETRRSVAAHPPATSEALADLLGKSAQGLVRVERKAIEECVKRIAELEERATQMLDTIDRTSRLNPLMEAPIPVDALEMPSSKAEPVASLFADLPQEAPREQLNWTVVLQVLSETEAPRGMRHIAQRAASDPDIARLRTLSRNVAADLAEDKVFVEDIAVEHVPASLWARFVKGARGENVLGLAGVSDEVMLALTRARMRQNPEFRAMALRHQRAYQAVLERAVTDLGADQKLVELAETKAGRIFMLIAGLTGIFERGVPEVAEGS